jgi:ATP-dependent Lon protease
MADEWDLLHFPTNFSIDQSTEPKELPLLAVSDTVLFPRTAAHLFVSRDQSLRAVAAAMGGDQRIAVFTQADTEVQSPSEDELYGLGTEAIVGRVWRMPDQTTSVFVQGQRRVRLLVLERRTPYLVARVLPVVEMAEPSLSSEALMRAVLTLFEKVVRLSRSMPDDALVTAMNVNEPGWLADLIASNLSLDVDGQQKLLEMEDPIARLEQISVLLAKELDVLELESRIHSHVQQEVDKSQREYFLREQMRAIQHELGESDPLTQEIAELQQRVAAAQLPEEVLQRAEKELGRLASMPSVAPESSVVRTYVEWLLDLPWATFLSILPCASLRRTRRAVRFSALWGHQAPARPPWASPLPKPWGATLCG